MRKNIDGSRRNQHPDHGIKTPPQPLNTSPLTPWGPFITSWVYFSPPDEIYSPANNRITMYVVEPIKRITITNKPTPS